VPEVTGPPDARPATEVTSGVMVDRDALTQAWGDGILRSLSARAKALFSGGRFVSVDEAGAHFALPNAAHRDRCLDLAAQVEAALTQHFGTPIRLVLEVDGGPDGAPPAAAAPRGGPPDTSPAGDGDYADEVDLEDIRAATTTDTDQASEAEARLLEAFPGASEVEQ
jgi:hypothetical protein